MIFRDRNYHFTFAKQIINTVNEARLLRGRVNDDDMVVRLRASRRFGVARSVALTHGVGGELRVIERVIEIIVV